MQGVSTLTQKGQVAIPKPIRDYFDLKASDKLYFQVKDNAIVARPIPSIDDMFGIIKTNKVLTKREMKRTIQKAVVERFRRKSLREE